MRALGPALTFLGFAAVLPGCLYVSEVNERPTASLIARSTSSSIGGDIALEARLADDQTGFHPEIVVRDSAGAFVTDDACIVGVHTEERQDDVNLTLVHVQVWKVGTFTVELTPVDRHGARGSTATVQLTFDNEPPAFTPDPIDRRAKVLRATSVASVCGTNWAAAVPIPIRLVGEVDDPDASKPPPFVTCTTKPAPLTYQFTIVSQPTLDGTLGPADTDGHCPLERPKRTTALDTDGPTVCLYPDPSLSSVSPAGYEVKLKVSDGIDDASTDTLLVSVVNDAPACLDGTYPKVGSYVLDRAAPTVFQAIGIDGVTASSQLGYVWTIRRVGETEYTTVAGLTLGADGGGRFALDPSIYGFAVGEHVSLRVDVVDPQPGDACDVTDDRCDVASCAATVGASCPRRTTWELEYR